MAHQNEQDIRLQILNTLLTCPHRDLAQIATVHAELQERDPRFYVRLAAWYNQTGAVRDHKEIFAATLIRSQWEGHRDVGLAMSRTRRLLPSADSFRHYVMDDAHERAPG